MLNEATSSRINVQCATIQTVRLFEVVRYNERCHRVKRQICGNIKMAFSLKLSYSKVRASFTHLGRGGHL